LKTLNKIENCTISLVDSDFKKVNCKRKKSRLAEAYTFPTKALCHWKLNEFRKAKTHIYGHFVIEKI
jgi:hypothetical protein